MEKWAGRKLIKFCIDESKILLGENKPTQQCRLKTDQLAPALQKRTHGSWEMTRWTLVNDVLKIPHLSGRSIASRSGEVVLCLTLTRLYQKHYVQFRAPRDKYRYWFAGASTAESTKVVGAGAYDGVATGNGLVQPGEVKAERRSYCCWEEQGANWAELMEENSLRDQQGIHRFCCNLRRQWVIWNQTLIF